MRTPNYKVGWLVKNKLAALTHYHSDITAEDLMGVYAESQQLLEAVVTPFHLIIDNRVAPLDKIYTLAELLQLSPLLHHPYLRYIVIIKPDHLDLGTAHGTLQKQALVSLQNVSSVQEGLSFLAQNVNDMDVATIDFGFFPEV